MTAAPEPARVIALALDPAVLTADDASSERILDAALALVAATGFKNLTMDDVARRAGLGRMTVYRRFGGRSALIEALAVRECRRCLARIGAAIDPDGSPSDRIAALTAATLAVIREHPLLERLARFEPEALLFELTRDDSAVFRLVREFLIELIIQGQAEGELAGDDPQLLAELALRLGASFVLMPESVLPLEDQLATREAVRTLFEPLLQRR